MTEGYTPIGQFEQAIALVADFSKRCERQADSTQRLLRTLAGLYQESEQFEQAIPLYEELVETAPNTHLRKIAEIPLIKAYAFVGELEKAKTKVAERLQNKEPCPTMAYSEFEGLQLAES